MPVRFAARHSWARALHVAFPMRKAVPFLLLFVAALAEAQVTDLAVSVALSPAAPMAGERVQVTLRVRNEGPVAPSFAEAVFSSTVSFIVFPAGGNCFQSLRVGDIRCSATGLAPGAELLELPRVLGLHARLRLPGAGFPLRGLGVPLVDLRFQLLHVLVAVHGGLLVGRNYAPIMSRAASCARSPCCAPGSPRA